MNNFIYYCSRPWFLILSLAFLLVPSIILTDALESGAEFLKIYTDARSGAMSSAGAALSQGINAISYNPAGLASIRRGEAALSHSAWYLGSAHDFVGAGFALPG